MAFSEIYVDPSIAADSGTGTSADPFGDLEYAIEQTTFDTTNGTRVNIKSGTDEVVAADLSAAMADTVTTAAWVPTSAAPCIFQGYTAVAGDGGKGGIDGNGGAVFNSTTRDYMWFIDLHIHNVTSSYCVRFDDWSGVVNCELDNSDTGGVSGGSNCYIVGNYIHNIGINGLAGMNQSTFVAHNYIATGVGTMTSAITGVTGCIYRNVIDVAGAADGIVGGAYAIILQNSIYSNGGTGEGIRDGGVAAVVLNNVVEGFSGSGGVGFDIDTQQQVYIYGGNSAYNNETNFASANDVIFDYGGNEALSSSPFTAPGSSDFSPVDTGTVKEGALPDDIADSQV